ncbi:hypothetical protein STCU_06072 [Strigomonas culicis]|uniref:ER membrane protein complex subunit 1 n=1 Tax=Strigomonas culicis TaxID=28005 RepID=S9VI83_9TRYP|nr:hypothetical protein STCU_06072 [Strigomonas culicis]|eukprot:EPY26801.1 hypothetical protein STCU_06072 [Strigomonas culicis]
MYNGNEAALYHVDTTADYEFIPPQKQLPLGAGVTALQLSADYLLATKGDSTAVIALASGAPAASASGVGASVLGQTALVVSAAAVVEVTDGKESETACEACAATLLADDGESAKPVVVVAKIVKDAVQVTYAGADAVTVQLPHLVGPVTVLHSFVDAEEQRCVLLKSANAHLYLIGGDKLVWERKEGLASPRATLISYPLSPMDHFHFNKVLLAVSRHSTLYSVPFEHMGRAIEVIIDFSAPLRAKLGVASLHGVTFTKLHREHYNVLSVRGQSGGNTFFVIIDIEKKVVTDIRVVSNMLIGSPNFYIDKKTLQIHGDHAPSSLLFYTAHAATGVIKGYKYDQDLKSEAVPTWSMRTPHPIVAHASGEDDGRTSVVNALHIYPNKTGEEPIDEVRHRYPCRNVIAVAYYEPMEEELPTLVVVALDTVTGSILGTVRHKNVEGAVHMIIVENNIVYYFMDAEKMRYLFGVWELFEEESGPTVRKSSGASPPQVIASFFARTDRVFSSNAAKAPVIVPSTLGVFGGPIASLSVTTSSSAIARKSIILAFKTGRVAIFELRQLLAGGQMPFPSDDKRQLTHVIIPSVLFATHRYRLALPEQITTDATRLESSCHVVVSGLDIFYVRSSSGKAFDLLNTDFNKSLLISLVAGFIGFTFLARYFVSRQTINSLWR